jgi:hypothetical protein
MRAYLQSFRDALVDAALRPGSQQILNGPGGAAGVSKQHTSATQSDTAYLKQMHARAGGLLGSLPTCMMAAPAGVRRTHGCCPLTQRPGTRWGGRTARAPHPHRSAGVSKLAGTGWPPTRWEELAKPVHTTWQGPREIAAPLLHGHRHFTYPERLQVI